MLENFVTSHLAGRVRVRHVALKDSAIGAEFCAFIQSISGIQCLEHKVLTGSLLVHYSPKKLSENVLWASLQQGLDWLNAKAHEMHCAGQHGYAAHCAVTAHKLAYPLSTFQKQRKKELVAHMKHALFTTLHRASKGNKKAHYTAGAAVAALSLMHMWRMRHMCS